MGKDNERETHKIKKQSINFISLLFSPSGRDHEAKCHHHYHLGSKEVVTIFIVAAPPDSLLSALT